MTAQSHLHEKIVADRAKMINVVGQHRSAGAEYAWTRGMLRYHIKHLADICKGAEDMAIVMQTLDDDARFALIEFYKVESANDRMSPTLATGMIELGLLTHCDTEDETEV